VWELNSDSSDGIPKLPTCSGYNAGLETELQVTETKVRLGKTTSLLGFNSRGLLHGQDGGRGGGSEVTEMLHGIVNGTTGYMS
jgi:hypothetical protein